MGTKVLKSGAQLLADSQSGNSQSYLPGGSWALRKSVRECRELWCHYVVNRYRYKRFGCVAARFRSGSGAGGERADGEFPPVLTFSHELRPPSNDQRAPRPVLWA